MCVFCGEVGFTMQYKDDFFFLNTCTFKTVIYYDKVDVYAV